MRLEALTDPSLASGGPGRREENGNFVVSEFALSVAPAQQGLIPEPGTCALLAMVGLLPLAAIVSRRRAARKPRQ